ncbi:sulfur stress regulator [Micractinium conductrix]|uniref:Sulfur stress regulator n=1 Tax=Micractinium conductrix TaxID=554055 RepID=A0A2P6VK79_9CHLO|nr:sulfur stress regulator [Micractinium conductrix]|eukprot:PSC74495.1 sulfur stress regulator [Micractinium conductrix]
MEHAESGDLFRYVSARRGLPEDEAGWFFQQLMIAVDYCHRMGVTNRDIKLENALLDGSPRPLIKLADFGFSKDSNDQSAPTSRVGTPAYLAPEVISNRMGQVYDGKLADLWSCGVLLYVMLLDRYPFRRHGDDEYSANQKLNLMLQRILVADYRFPDDRVLSESAKDLIRRMLVPHPSLRLPLTEILSHPWFLEGLHPAALAFNDQLVEESRANQLAPEVLEEARQIVREASRQSPALAAPVQQQHLDALQQQQQQQQQQQRPPSREGTVSGEIRDQDSLEALQGPDDDEVRSADMGAG